MTLFLLLLCFWWFESLAALVSSYTFILWETHKLTNTQSCVFIFKDHFILSLFVCLFKGGVLVSHTCLTNWIRICSVPQSLDPTPHPRGCIIGTRHESRQGFWTGLIFLFVFDPKPLEAKRLGLRTVIVLCGLPCNLSLTTEPAKGCIIIIIISEFHKVFLWHVVVVQGTKIFLNQTGFHTDPNVLISLKTSSSDYSKIGGT